MAKYSVEFKLKIVQEYLQGKGGLSYLSKKYSVKSKTQIGDWINTYREFGKDGLLQKRQHQDYAFHFKLDAIELYQTTELTYREVAYHFGINNPALIANWMRIFRTEGPDGLSRTKGRSCILPKKKEDKSIRKEQSKELDRIKELEKQVRSLEIENAFLKELRKLRKREAQQRRQNQSHASSTASEDHSN